MFKLVVLTVSISTSQQGALLGYCQSPPLEPFRSLLIQQHMEHVAFAVELIPNMLV